MPNLSNSNEFKFDFYHYLSGKNEINLFYNKILYFMYICTKSRLCLIKTIRKPKNP